MIPPIFTRRTHAGEHPLDAAWDELYRQASERLVRRMETLKVPEPTTFPRDDVSLIYRLPNEYKGAIEIPEQFRHRHDAQYSVGLLLCMGLDASMRLEADGFLPGDYVQFARYAGEEETAARVAEAIKKAEEEGLSQQHAERLGKKVRDEETSKAKYIRVQVPLIHQSVDLAERLRGPTPTMRLVREVGPKGAVHVIEPVIENVLNRREGTC